MKHVQGLMYEYLQGELDPARAKQVQEHIASCNACFAELQVLKEGARLVRPLSGKPSEHRSEAYWHNFAVHVQQRVQQGPKKTVSTNPVRNKIESFLTYQPQRVLALVGGLAVLVALITIAPFRTVQEEQSLMLTEGSPAGGVMPVNAELTDYFRKSKILLIGLTNMTPPEGQTVDFRAESQTARKLIQQARVLEDQDIDNRTQQLIWALEKILIELANMEDRANLPDVELIRTGIRQENMLFKIRMAEAQQSHAMFSTADHKEIKQQ